ncbi:phosphotransferase [Actinomadura sp. SCN-SB]
MVGPAGGQVVGVLDWEMAILGDPLTDPASAVI